MISERIPVETNAFACMLGGEDGKRCSFAPQTVRGRSRFMLREKSGKIEVVEVDVPEPVNLRNILCPEI